MAQWKRKLRPPLTNDELREAGPHVYGYVQGSTARGDTVMRSWRRDPLGTMRWMYQICHVGGERTPWSPVEPDCIRVTEKHLFKEAQHD